MTFPAGSVLAAVCTPSIRAHLNTQVFVSYVFPPIAGYFTFAALAVTAHTHAIRVALWPLVTLSALRAVVSVDMSSGKPDQNFFNTMLMFSTIFVITRTLDWTLEKKPLTRRPHSTNKSRSIILDAVDLALALRGHEWDWSHGVYIPRETRPTSRRGFLCDVILSAAVHTLLCGLLHMAIRLLVPVQVRTLSGGSIFDDALPFYARYARASMTSVLAVIIIYTFIQMCYDACTVVGVLVLGQDPARWPPAFDAPWRATSLTDLWGRRWHQFFRRMFLIQGGYPLSFFLGRAGLVIGAFLSSGMMHHITMAVLNEELAPWRMMVGFGMMAPGVLAEQVFRQWTGRKVCGVAGWVWTMAWFLVWGNLIIDATARAGVYGGHFSVIERVIPGREVVERLMMDLFKRVAFS